VGRSNSVSRGDLTSKQLENEFKSVVSSEHWKWSTRKIADNKFTMRFPNAKMVLEYSKFNLGVKGLDVQFSVEPWTSASSAKGQLQQAWFKVRGIPVDQRGLRTIAKIGGLVGKTMAIDEQTRFSRDYVRIKIACRNVELVPPSAEGTLGLYIYDFFFDREYSQEEQLGDQTAAGEVDIPDIYPSPKKPRTESININASSSKAGNGQNLGNTTLQGKQQVYHENNPQAKDTKAADDS